MRECTSWYCYFTEPYFVLTLGTMTTEEFKKLASSFPGTIERPHFDRTAFKVEGKRNFATLHEASRSFNAKLSLDDQATFCEYEKGTIYPVPNKWGLQGWTTIELEGTPDELIQEALDAAYQEVFKSKK